MVYHNSKYIGTPRFCVGAPRGMFVMFAVMSSECTGGPTNGSSQMFTVRVIAAMAD